ncbi:MAG TPA: hypothetical protein VEO18_09715 [Thermoplasmata archaeon]|nr:hypothetical protein [Thermoplasmata archaeon]
MFRVRIWSGGGASTETRTILKLYLHGILFYLLSLLLTLGWVFLAAFLIIFGFLIGLAIAIAILVLLVGFANAAVTRGLWFPVKGGWRVYFLQGLVLGFVVLLVGFLLAGISFFLSPLVGVVMFFVLAPPIFGAAGLWVAGFFRFSVSRGPMGPAEPWTPPRPVASVESRTGTFQRHVVCPKCGTGYDFVSESITRCPKDGTPLRHPTQAV